MKSLIVSAIEAFRKEPKQYQALKAIVDGINAVRAALGDGTYAENPQYGKWGTVFVGAHAMRAGSVAPVWASTMAGDLPGFGAGAWMSGVLEVPESYVAGSLTAKVLFTFASPPTAGTTRTWGLLFAITTPGGAITGTTTLAADYSCRAGDAESTCAVRIPITDAGLRPGAIISFRVSRSDGATPIPYLIGVSWAYRKQRFGLEERP